MSGTVVANLPLPTEANEATPSIRQRFQTGWASTNSLLCVGLDPLAERLPLEFHGKSNGFRDFCCAIVDATASEVCAFKPQVAHFSAVAAEQQLVEVIAYIHARHPHIPVILDAKRNDIGATAALYAKEAFARYDADIVTVNPYLGLESLQPFLAYPGRGIAVLCRTSNTGSDWLQCDPPDEPVFLRVAHAVAQSNERGNLMLVAGATHPQDLARIRAVAETVPLLVPGIGAQGGDLHAVLEAGLDGNGQGLVVNASRSVLYASRENFAEAAHREARRLRESILTITSALMSVRNDDPRIAANQGANADAPWDA